MVALAEIQGLCERHEAAILLLATAFALALRCAVALFPYSGEGKPPMYGDFEAQRHWMEITTALPLLQWYQNSTDNDLMYWGLDYPPVTAYHSLLIGAGGRALVPDCFRLRSSRGHETAECRLFMRASAIASDALVYFPGALCAVRGFATRDERAAVRVAALLALWALPPLVLVDHGHFQYNGVCFGLCLAAAGLVAKGRTLAGSVLFTLGLLFKQIALYYAPAFFFGILAVCVHTTHSAAAALGQVLITGCVVLSTAAAVFAPWLLLAADPAAAVLQVLRRMFPFARGLYEDKVANVWCSISVVVKLNRLLPAGAVPIVCAAATFAALAPACAWCLRARPPGHGDAGGGGPFAAALVASAFAFFLFAFQVHEKSILFPCVAACLLPIAVGPQRRPVWAAAALGHLVLVCLFSMYPLVVKDGLRVPYAAFCLALAAACEVAPAGPLLRGAHRLSYLLGLALHAVHALVPAPARYPDAWTLLITGSSCAYFLACLAAVTAAQLLGAFGPGGGARAAGKEE